MKDEIVWAPPTNFSFMQKHLRYFKELTLADGYPEIRIYLATLISKLWASLNLNTTSKVFLLQIRKQLCGTSRFNHDNE